MKSKSSQGLSCPVCERVLQEAEAYCKSCQVDTRALQRLKAWVQGC